MRNTDAALKWIVGILDKKDIPYQISGGFAAKIYGSERKLNDIDIDIPETNFDDILSDIKEYLIYGPDNYVDGKWNIKLMTVNYHGQEIDIAGAFEGYVSNKNRTAWLKIKTDFENARDIKIDSLMVKVIHPPLLIEYKQHLDGNHQMEDIQAVQKFMEKVKET